MVEYLQQAEVNRPYPYVLALGDEGFCSQAFVVLSPFQWLGQQMKDISGDGGVLKQVVQPGTGLYLPKDASVSIRFSGFLEYSDKPFDSNTQLRHPHMMKLGRELTLTGLELGLLSMRKGEFSRFLLNPQYAYGKMGCPPLIPPAATVLFEVQVIDFFDFTRVDSFTQLNLEEQNGLPLSTLLDVVNMLRNFGNRCFKQSRYFIAIEYYKQAVVLLRNRKTGTVEERDGVNAALLPLYTNLSLNHLRLESPQKALKNCSKALEIDPSNTKALYLCGQAYLEMYDYEKAHDYLVRAQARKPFDRDINSLLMMAAIGYKDDLDKQKDMYSKMFKTSGYCVQREGEMPLIPEKSMTLLDTVNIRFPIGSHTNMDPGSVE
ncbi:inactive peptidyl-prolyl cis-trans isomerase FKBP6 [Lampris incognitus]|uniref:inactive peptidyl-prolyl cis-trans isomerase FKBP6 n=1 Tax=Lampris incognitus TaxID=2546036 RepID=UPI0024B59836|nr:inactive peptidyl-prolyl cis-trans isomerase FKBP6 [Lampris incognitus]